MNHDDLDKLYHFQRNASKITFVDIYTSKNANHLWEKFDKINGNILNFYFVLDEDNRKKLIDYINSNDTRNLKN